MTDLENNPTGLPAGLPSDLPAKPPPARRPFQGLRRFGLFVLLLVLACGIFILVTNGLYYWYSQPLQTALINGRSLIDGGVPAAARSEEERLAYYQSCIDSLAGLPGQLADLNRQPWAFAVLLPDDPGEAQIQTLLDKAERGRLAVRAYLQVVREIQAGTATFLKQVKEPADPGVTSLPGRLAWYTQRIAEADRLAQLFAESASQPDLNLAGTLYSRQELGLDEVSAAVSGFRQPILDLQALLADSSQLEDALDLLYALEPEKSALAGTESSCAEFLSRQQLLSSRAAELKNLLPLPLQPAFEDWRAGLAGRSAFIEALQAWWQYTVQTGQSVESAATDRATARRYIADSLKETNVETAYLWTKTAQDYRASMNTAIDFANIYIGKARKQIQLLAASRLSYRPALGLAISARQIEAPAQIKAAAFWLEG